MDSTQKLLWADIEPAAKEAFIVWVGQPELAWARAAWAALDDAGLTTFKSKLQRTRVAIRFLCLAALYRDFAEVAWEEDWDPDFEIASWAELLAIPRFHVETLADEMGFAFLDPTHDEGDPAGESIPQALLLLANAARPALVSCLARKWGRSGGYSGTDMLFVTLCRSKVMPYEDMDDDSDSHANQDDHEIEGASPGLTRIPLTVQEQAPDITAEAGVGYVPAQIILNQGDFNDLRPYEWLTNGAEPLHEA